MTFQPLSALLAAMALATLPVPVPAQDRTGANVGTPPADAAPGGAATLGLAQQLYALGVAQGDAVTVLAAAKLAASVAVEPRMPRPLDVPGATIAAIPRGTGYAPDAARPLDGAATVSLATGGTPQAADPEGAADRPVAAAAMFAVARDLAAGDEVLLDLIANAMAEGSRGRLGRAVQWRSRLPAGQTDVWEMPFHGNSYAEIAVVGDGDADLDIAVTDENGNILCYDVSRLDALYCDFTPAWDGYFYVTVQNVGRVRNSYYLLTN